MWEWRVEAVSSWQTNTVQHDLIDSTMHMNTISKRDYLGDSTRGCSMRVLLQNMFSEVRHPGESVQARGREAHGCTGHLVGLLFLFPADTCPAKPSPRSACPRKVLLLRRTPLPDRWPVTSSPAMRTNIMNMPGHSVNHAMQSRQELSIIFMLEHFFPLNF